MSVPEPANPSTTTEPPRRRPASVPSSDLSEAAADVAAKPVSDSPTRKAPRTTSRVNRERPDFDGTPPMVKVGYVIAGVVILVMFAMAVYAVLA